MRAQGTARIPACLFATGAWLLALGLILGTGPLAFALPVTPHLAAQVAHLACLTQSQSYGGNTPSNPGPIVRLLSVGMVLTSDGTIWQYTPDQRRWLTIDEAFKLQKKETHILPLPVGQNEIRDMQTFGFLLAVSGDCWLYNMASGRWEKLPLLGR